jgi:hypothetical protein
MSHRPYMQGGSEVVSATGLRFFGQGIGEHVGLRTKLLLVGNGFYCFSLSLIVALVGSLYVSTRKATILMCKTYLPTSFRDMVIRRANERSLT